jgi:hypothetical protein
MKPGTFREHGKKFLGNNPPLPSVKLPGSARGFCFFDGLMNYILKLVLFSVFT